MRKEKKLTNFIVKTFNVYGTVIITRELLVIEGLDDTDIHRASVWVSKDSIELITAETFMELCRKTFNTLDAMGLKK